MAERDTDPFLSLTQKAGACPGKGRDTPPSFSFYKEAPKAIPNRNVHTVERKNRVVSPKPKRVPVTSRRRFPLS